MKNIYSFGDFLNEARQRTVFRLLNNLKNSTVGSVKVTGDDVLNITIEHKHPMKGKPEVEEMKFKVDKNKKTLEYEGEKVDIDIKTIKNIEDLCKTREAKAKKKVMEDA